MTSVGDKVRLTAQMEDLPAGLTGEVSFIDAIGTVHVNWENGANLGMIPGQDHWEVLTDVEVPGAH